MPITAIYRKAKKILDLEVILYYTTEFGICYSAEKAKAKKYTNNYPAKLTLCCMIRYKHY
jgi:hypothetical protein